MKRLRGAGEKLGGIITGSAGNFFAIQSPVCASC